MKRFLNKIGIWIMLLLVLAIPTAEAAADKSTILLNGEMSVYTGWLQNGRMMLPSELLTTLGIIVEVDQDTSMVRIHNEGTNLIFFLEEERAAINETRFTLEAIPIMQGGSLYLPLRFTMEGLGAGVVWDAEKGQVNILWGMQAEAKPVPQKESPMNVFAYYYYPAHQELKEQGHLFTDLALRWFETNGQGELFYEYQDDYDKVLKIADEMGIRTHASVVLMGKVPLHELLSVPQNRQRLIMQLVNTAEKYGGINIDFELMDPADGKYLTLFLQELKAAMPKDKILSAAVMARTETDRWATPYEYERIGEICDLVVVMSYDYSYPGSDPGPVAPLWWVEKVADYMQANIASEKVYLGVANYGYDFAQSGKTKSVIRSSLDAISGRYQVSRSFDRNSMSPYYTYWDAAGELHYVWLENQESLQAKYDLIKTYGFGGISFWRIGTGFQDIYKILP